MQYIDHITRILFFLQDTYNVSVRYTCRSNSLLWLNSSWFPMQCGLQAHIWKGPSNALYKVPKTTTVSYCRYVAALCPFLAVSFSWGAHFDFSSLIRLSQSLTDREGCLWSPPTHWNRWAAFIRACCSKCSKYRGLYRYTWRRWWMRSIW